MFIFFAFVEVAIASDLLSAVPWPVCVTSELGCRRGWDVKSLIVLVAEFCPVGLCLAAVSKGLLLLDAQNYPKRLVKLPSEPSEPLPLPPMPPGALATVPVRASDVDPP